MRWYGVVALTAMLACTGPADPSVPSVASVEPSTRASPVLPREARPVPEPSPWPLPRSGRRDHPTSSDVAIGRTRPFELYTHCGIDFGVDFDGSFWQSYGDVETPTVGNPFRKGTMILLTEEVAVFRFDSDGSETSIYFVRNDTPKPRVGCD